MAVVMRCKLCGGELTLTEGSPVAVCEYCGARQTVPTLDSEKKLTLFARAGRLLRGCEFDKAAGIYESIAAEFSEEAEAYWCLVLCKYGIEYVDDPGTGKKVPTCHRSSFESVLEDENYDLALEYADIEASRLYRQEARQIEELRRNIIEVSGREEPYDIFICYKETAANGDRTLDSVLAQDIYDALTEKGYRLFFSRVTLEDKLGQEYEPYIFAALNSATVMLVVGTDYEHYNAVWVKNEWSRFLQLMASGKKKYLIPCFKGMDPYDMPKEFARLQSQDMGKVGAMQDLLRGVEKLMGKNQAPAAPAAQVVYQAASGGATVESLLQRGMLFLNDGDFDRADEYFEKVLDIDPQMAGAYIGKLLVKLRLRREEQITAGRMVRLDGIDAYGKIMQYGDGQTRARFKGYNDEAIRRSRELGEKAQAVRDAVSSGKKELTSLDQACTALQQQRDGLHAAKERLEDQRGRTVAKMPPVFLYFILLAIEVLVFAFCLYPMENYSVTVPNRGTFYVNAFQSHIYADESWALIIALPYGLVFFLLPLLLNVLLKRRSAMGATLACEAVGYICVLLFGCVAYSDEMIANVVYMLAFGAPISALLMALYTLVKKKNIKNARSGLQSAEEDYQKKLAAAGSAERLDRQLQQADADYDEAMDRVRGAVHEADQAYRDLAKKYREEAEQLVPEEFQ